MQDLDTIIRINKEASKYIPTRLGVCHQCVNEDRLNEDGICSGCYKAGHTTNNKHKCCGRCKGE